MPGPDYVTPSSAQKGAEAARKATGIGPTPAPSRARALLEWLTGYPADPTREMNPLEVLAAVPALGAGGKALKGATHLDEAADAAQKGIRAFHGSPHDFDRFDLSKIGTGEGAQAYGHGLYFAGNEGVAKGYRDSLTYAHHLSGSRQQGEAVFDTLAASGTISGKVPVGPNQRLMSRDDLAEAFVSGRLNAFSFPPGVQKRVQDALLKDKGRMYEVNINADPASLLDWDAPLHQQSIPVQTELGTRLRARELGLTGAAAHGGVPTGADVYSRLGRPKVAAQYLNDIGIPGIKYLDQGSRAAGQGTSNYTIFDDKLISILRKYGLLGAAGAGAATQRDALLQQLQGDGAQ